MGETSNSGMLIIGLKCFAVGTFDSTASEHSSNAIQVVMHIITWFIAQMSLLGGYIDGTSFEERALSFGVLVCLNLSIAKFAMFSLNRNALHEFIKLIDIEAVTRTKTDVYVKKAIKGIAVTLRSYAFIAIFGSLTYVAVALYSDKRQSQQIERKYWEIFHIYVPYDAIVFERISIPRIITTIFIFYHSYCQIFLDIVAVTLFTHVGWQFEATADMFKDVPYSQNQAESKVRLKEVIDYHQYILRYAENLQKMYNGVFLVELVLCCLPLCFSMLLCVQNLKSGQDVFMSTMSHVSFLSVITFQLFLYTRCADLTKEKARSVSDGVYLSDWHLTTPSTRRDLIWVLMRAQHPINYSAMGMFPMTIATFSQILQIAYGAFSMMTSLD